MKKFFGIFLLPLIATACTTIEHSARLGNQKPITTDVISSSENIKDFPQYTFNSQSNLLIIMSLPAFRGFNIIHTPSPAHLTEKTKAKGYPYSWIYQTSLQSKRRLKIVEFGVFDYINGEWTLVNFTGKPFTSKDFETWYHCPNAILEKNIACTDTENWSASKTLYGEDKTVMWYFIGQDDNGKLYQLVQPINLIYLKNTHPNEAKIQTP